MNLRLRRLAFLTTLLFVGVSAAVPAQSNDDPGTTSDADDTTPPELRKAFTRYQEGEPEEACAAFESLSKNPENLLSIARFLCFASQDFERGESFARRCAEEVPGSEAWHPLMTLLLLTGETRELEKLSRQKQAEFPDDHGIFFYLGLSLTRQNKSAESIEVFEQLVKLEPENLSFRYALGDACLKGRREADAEAHFRKVRELDPDNKEGVWRLADTLAILGRDAEAEKVYKAGIQQNNREAGFRYGVFLFQRDQFQAALPYFKSWTTDSPDRSLAWAYLGRCHLQLGRKRLADKALEKFRELRRKVDTEENEELSRILRMRREEAAGEKDGR